MSEFADALALTLGLELRALARRESRSKTLADTLTLQVDGRGTVKIASPFYWARWYHDGRGAVRARRGHKLVYFKDPSRDPRIPNRRYPRTRSDVRRLTKSEFYRYLRDPKSGMIVTDRVGPWEGDPFFVRAARRFKVRVPGLARKEFSPFLQRELRDVLALQLSETFRF